MTASATANPGGDPTLVPASPVASPQPDPPDVDEEVVEAPRRRSLMDRVDTFISRLSTRNNFWHRVCSMIWLPYAFHSGIRMKRVDPNTFTTVLPFRKFNQNWYKAMAGASLLANAEISGGMYLFALLGGEFTVVCKEITYRFLRPCLGPALYRIEPVEDVKNLATQREFNVTLKIQIVQMIPSRARRERRVGECVATFHATCKRHQQSKGRAIRP